MVTTTYLQQLSPSDLVPARAPRVDARVECVPNPEPELARSLYLAVGADWQWTDRLPWPRERWVQWLARPGVEIWLATVHGLPAGYVELDPRAETDGLGVEIAYFGLMPDYIGRGLGGHLLTTGLRAAWSLPERWPSLAPVSRVWLHTCSLDAPAALPNYVARGLEPYHSHQQAGGQSERDEPQRPAGQAGGHE